MTCTTIIGALLLSRAVSTPEMAAEIVSGAENIVVGLMKQGLPTGIVPQGELRRAAAKINAGFTTFAASIGLSRSTS